MDNRQVDRMSLVRTILLIIALLNQLLVSFGYSPLPFDNTQMELGLSALFTVIAALWAWWKNNYLSKKGQKQKEVLRSHDLYQP